MSHQTQGLFGTSSRGDSLRRRIISSTSLQQKPALPQSTLPRREQIEVIPISPQREQISASSDRNIKFKLQSLQQKIGQISADVHNMRQQNRQLIELTALLKQDLVYTQLLDMKKQMQETLLDFSKYLRACQNQDESRYNLIHEDIGSLWQETEQRRSQVFELRMRVEVLEAKMGFNSQYQ